MDFKAGDIVYCTEPEKLGLNISAFNNLEIGVHTVIEVLNSMIILKGNNWAWNKDRFIKIEDITTVEKEFYGI